MGDQPGMGPDPESRGPDVGNMEAGNRGGDPRGMTAEQREAARLRALELERQRKLAEKRRLKRERFKKHRQKASSRKSRVMEVSDLDDMGQGQVNKSLTTMKKYRDQSGMAKWDLQEVKDNPHAGLNRIAAIREGLKDDEETYNSYMTALRQQLQDNHYSETVLDVTAPTNKGRKFKGDINKGFRMLTASL